MKKELFRFFGDKRMAITTIFLPGFLIYCVYSFMGTAITDKFTTDNEYKPSISVVNLPDSVNQLAASSKLNLIEVNSDDVDDLKNDVSESDMDLVVVFPENFDQKVENYSVSSGKAAPNIEMYYNSSESNSQAAYSKMMALLDGYESMMTNKFDINNSAASYDLAKEEDLTGQIFSSMMPMLLLVFMFSGCMAVAPESIAGEKERGTIATLLITPTKRAHIALGKIFALSIIAVLSGFSSTLGTILSLPKLVGGAESGMVTNVYKISDYILLGIVIISTVLILVTAISIISAFAKTIKEAQTYISPFMIVIVLIGVSAMFGSGIKNDLYFYMIPLYNSVQCMTGIFSFEIAPTYIAITVVANVIYTGLGVFILTKMFNSEKVIFSK